MNILDTGKTGSAVTLSPHPPGADPEQSKTGRKDFSEMVEDAVSSVNRDMSTANSMIEQMAAGQDVGIAETMIAISKADISFRMMLQVRNKALSAYEEIMRMQV